VEFPIPLLLTVSVVELGTGLEQEPGPELVLGQEPEPGLELHRQIGLCPILILKPQLKMLFFSSLYSLFVKFFVDLYSPI